MNKTEIRALLLALYEQAGQPTSNRDSEYKRGYFQAVRDIGDKLGYTTQLDRIDAQHGVVGPTVDS